MFSISRIISRISRQPMLKWPIPILASVSIVVSEIVECADLELIRWGEWHDTVIEVNANIAELISILIVSMFCILTGKMVCICMDDLDMDDLERLVSHLLNIHNDNSEVQHFAPSIQNGCDTILHSTTSPISPIRYITEDKMQESFHKQDRHYIAPSESGNGDYRIGTPITRYLTQETSVHHYDHKQQCTEYLNEQIRELHHQDSKPGTNLLPSSPQIALHAAYEEVTHWKQNMFPPPPGDSGKNFVQEMARLFQASADPSSTNGVSMKAITVFQKLVLQEPPREVGKPKDYAKYLQRRLDLWLAGDTTSLMEEGRNIQKQLPTDHNSPSKNSASQTFTKHMKHGNIQGALKSLLTSPKGPRNLDDKASSNTGESAIYILHHAGTAPPPDILLVGHSLNKDANPQVFNQLNADLILKAALDTHGSSGPSGLNASAWKRMCSQYGSASLDLCSALAAVGRKLCTTEIDTETVVTCKLVDDQHSCQTIGVCDVPRRIISKAVLWLLSADILAAAGPLQVGARHKGGAEAAIHVMRRVREESKVEGVLSIENRDAFSTINRLAALHNISTICPSISQLLWNCYCTAVRQLLPDRTGEIYSCEGVIRGDPLATVIYDLAMTPLIRTLHRTHPDTIQVWNADTAAVAGSCGDLRRWWDSLRTLGTRYGYVATQAVLVAKPEFEEVGKAVFTDAGVEITTLGHGHLGAILGAKEFREEYVRGEVEKRIREVQLLAHIAAAHPHYAYSAFHSMASRWSFLTRTIPDIQHLLLPLEQEIRHKLLPALTGRQDITGTERRILALPARLGGLGIADPSSSSQTSFQNSVAMTAPQVNLILEQDIHAVVNPKDIAIIKKNITECNHVRQKAQVSDLERDITPQQKRLLHLARERGSSSWLTVPAEEGLFLSKQEFTHALHLRYGWDPRNPPHSCLCGSPFSIDHTLACKKAGVQISIRREIRDITTSMLERVCCSVTKEHLLQPSSGEPFTLDIRAGGLWDGNENVFLHITVFNPNTAPTQRSQKVPTTYDMLESSRRRKYDPLVWGHGTFTPLVFSTMGGMGKEADSFYRRLAGVVSKKKGRAYSVVIGQMRSHLSLAIIRTSTKPLHKPNCLAKTSPTPYH